MKQKKTKEKQNSRNTQTQKSWKSRVQTDVRTEWSREKEINFSSPPLLTVSNFKITSKGALFQTMEQAQRPTCSRQSLPPKTLCTHFRSKALRAGNQQMRSPVYRQAHSKSCRHRMQTHNTVLPTQMLNENHHSAVLQAELDFLASHMSINSALSHHPTSFFCTKRKLANMVE